MKIKNSILLKILLIITAVFLIMFEFFNIKLFDDVNIAEMINTIITRCLAGVFSVALVYYLGYKIFNPIKKPVYKTFLIILPCLIIVVNNLPAIALITKTAYVTEPIGSILLFALSCFFVGFFEEVLFRGIVLLLFLERCEKSVKSVFKAIIYSSLIFGFVHLFNLFSGAGIGSVVLQIGYSFLLGCMWATILIITKNIWFCIAMHAIYNFCGLLLPTLGTGTWWDTPTIIITVLLSISVALYIIRIITKLNPTVIDSLFLKP